MIFSKNNQMDLKIIVLFLALLLFSLFSLSFGQVEVPLKNILAIILHKIGIPLFSVESFTTEQEAIVWFIRMPRMLVGVLVGCALATSGAVMQGIFSNPLADPGLIGVSAGATTGAVLSIVLGFTQFMPAFAFCGSAIAVVLTVCLAIRNGKLSVLPLLLSGVAVGMLLGAFTSGLLIFLNSQRLSQYLFWMVGGLDYRTWEHVYLAMVPICLGIIFILALARHLNILVLGDVEAKAVGMNVNLYRMLLLFVASIITAISVCVSGNIGFVGLVIPHMMRIIIGPDHRYLLPASALGGGLFLVLCDSLGRIIISPVEVRVGIMTALLGTPYFLYLLRRMRKQLY